MTNVNPLKDNLSLVDVKIINQEPYGATGRILLKLLYEGKNKSCKYTYELPCVELPIDVFHINIEQEWSEISSSRAHLCMLDDKCRLRADPVVKIIEEYAREMTIKEIEKALGYSIKIVGDKK